MGRPIMRQTIEHRLGWTWWTQKGSYARVFLRELSAVFLLTEVVLLVLLLYNAGQTASHYRDYLTFLWNPWMVSFHIVAFGFALWHSTTFFLLAPSALPLRIAGRRIPASFIILQQFAGLAMVSLLVGAWIAWVGAT